MAKPTLATSPLRRTTAPLRRSTLGLSPAVDVEALLADPADAAHEAPAAANTERGGSIAIHQATIPLSMAAELLTTFAGEALSNEDLAATVMRLGKPAAGWFAAGTSSASASDNAEAPIDVARHLADHGRASEAEALLRQALITEGARHGRDTSLAFALELALSDHLARHDAIVEAKRMLVSTIERERSVLGPRHLGTMRSLERLGTLLVDEGELGYAEPLLCEVVLVRRNELGDEHPETIAALSSLARLLLAQGKANQAEPLLRRALRQQAADAEAGQAAMNSRRALAQTLLAQGNVADAEALLSQGLRLARSASGWAHVGTLDHAAALGQFLLDNGRPADARRLLTDAFATADKMCADGHSLPNRLRALLGESQRLLGNLAQAEVNLLAAYDGLRHSLGLANTATQRVLQNLIAMYTSWGKPAAAAPFRAVHAQCS